MSAYDGTKATVYTSALDGVHFLLQGDGISSVSYWNLPNVSQSKEINVILLSNTCDMSLDNSRKNACRVSYTPLIPFDNYAKHIRTQFPNQADSHLKDVRLQKITQIMFLPKGGRLNYDAIAFFDRMISLPLSKILVSDFCDKKLFTLSDFGFYLLLLKISFHFSRIQEKIDRNDGKDVGIKK